MSENSQGRFSRTSWDATQLLNVVNRPVGPEWKLDALVAFASSKDYVGVARRLDNEDVAKLVDVLDQVCRPSLQDTFTRLTTAMAIRPSDPSIGGKLKLRHCCAH